MIISELISVLSSYKLTLYDEKILQSEIQNILDEKAISYEREKRLDSRNIVDFMIDNDIAMEIKIKGSKSDIFRQCKRYCEFDQVKRLLLVTNKSMGLPEAINKKPCHVFNLGASWL